MSKWTKQAQKRIKKLQAGAKKHDGVINAAAKQLDDWGYKINGDSPPPPPQPNMQSGSAQSDSIETAKVYQEELLKASKPTDSPNVGQSRIIQKIETNELTRLSKALYSDKNSHAAEKTILMFQQYNEKKHKNTNMNLEEYINYGKEGGAFSISETLLYSMIHHVLEMTINDNDSAKKVIDFYEKFSIIAISAKDNKLLYQYSQKAFKDLLQKASKIHYKNLDWNKDFKVYHSIYKAHSYNPPVSQSSEDSEDENNPFGYKNLKKKLNTNNNDNDSKEKPLLKQHNNPFGYHNVDDKDNDNDSKEEPPLDNDNSVEDFELNQALEASKKSFKNDPANNQLYNYNALSHNMIINSDDDEDDNNMPNSSQITKDEIKQMTDFVLQHNELIKLPELSSTTSNLFNEYTQDTAYNTLYEYIMSDDTLQAMYQAHINPQDKLNEQQQEAEFYQKQQYMQKLKQDAMKKATQQQSTTYYDENDNMDLVNDNDVFDQNTQQLPQQVTNDSSIDLKQVKQFLRQKAAQLKNESETLNGYATVLNKNNAEQLLKMIIDNCPNTANELNQLFNNNETPLIGTEDEGLKDVTYDSYNTDMT